MGTLHERQSPTAGDLERGRWELAREIDRNSLRPYLSSVPNQRLFLALLSSTQTSFMKNPPTCCLPFNTPP